MSIDTRNKRASCIGLNGPYRIVLPNPDVADEDVYDRHQMGLTYSGIGSEVPQSAETKIVLLVNSQQRVRSVRVLFF